MLDNILGAAENVISNFEFFLPQSRKHRIFTAKEVTNGEEKIQNQARNEQVMMRDVNQFVQEQNVAQQRKAADTVGNGFARVAPSANPTAPEGSTPLAFLRPISLR